MSEPTSAVVQEQALRDNANRMLALCTDEQRAFFHRIHDGAPWKGWANCPVQHQGRHPLSAAHDLLCRTMDENARRAALRGSSDE